MPIKADSPADRVHLIAKPNTPAHLHPLQAIDWHAQSTADEPWCGADQWRTRDRMEVTYMHEMATSHLLHCIRFARTKGQHASRLPSLLREMASRSGA